MKKLFATLLSAVIIQCSYAQILNPLNFNYATVKKGANLYEVHVKTVIDPGWHIYSTLNSGGGALSTSLSFTNARAIGTAKEIGKMKTIFEKEFNVNQKFFEDKVEFVQMVKFLPGNKKVSGEVDYMACNDRQCLPPKKATFEIPL